MARGMGFYSRTDDVNDASIVLTCMGRGQFCKSVIVDSNDVNLFIGASASGPAKTDPMDELAASMNEHLRKELSKIDHPKGFGPKDVHIIMTPEGWYFRYVKGGSGISYEYQFPEERGLFGRFVYFFTRPFERRRPRD